MKLRIILAALILLQGCSTALKPEERRGLANSLAVSAGMTKTTVAANGFALVAYQRIGAPGKPLTVYIEGDGLAWKSRRRLSDDPTPTDPVALRLAVQDPSDNLVYLARPCQYLKKSERRRCSQVHWSTQRFSEDVIAASDQAIEYFRKQARSPAVALIGYSGGGAVAALVAARRKDVLSLRTVAGNLDHGAFTAHHGVTPLTGSLNPSSYAASLANLPQRHFTGADDRIVPAFIAESFVRSMASQGCAHLTTVQGASHGAGWVKNWRRLLSLPLTCGASRKSM